MVRSSLVATWALASLAACSHFISNVPPNAVASGLPSLGLLTAGGGQLVWTQADGDGTWSIWRLAESGGDPVTVVAGRTEPTTLALDASRVYWIDSTDDAIYAVPLDNADPTIEPTVLTSQLTGPEVFVLAAGGAFVVQTAGVLAASLVFVDFGDGSVTTLAPNVQAFPPMVTDGTALYVGLYDPSCMSATCNQTLVTRYTADGAPSTQVMGMGPTVFAMALDGATLDFVGQAWPDADYGVFSVPLAGGTPVAIAPTASTTRVLVGWSGTVAWNAAGTVSSAPEAGGAPVQLLAPDAGALATDQGRLFASETTDHGSAIVALSP